MNKSKKELNKIENLIIGKTEKLKNIKEDIEYLEHDRNTNIEDFFKLIEFPVELISLYIFAFPLVYYLINETQFGILFCLPYSILYVEVISPRICKYVCKKIGIIFEKNIDKHIKKITKNINDEIKAKEEEKKLVQSELEKLYLKKHIIEEELKKIEKESVEVQVDLQLSPINGETVVHGIPRTLRR